MFKAIKGQPILSKVVAGIITSLIISFVVWTFPGGWDTVKEWVSVLWHCLGCNVSIPVWLLIVFTLGALVVAALRAGAVGRSLKGQLKGSAAEEINELETENQKLAESNMKLISEKEALNSKLAELQKVEFYEHDLGLKFKRSAETGNEWRLVCQKCGRQAVINYNRDFAIACCAAGCDYLLCLPKGTTPESRTPDIGVKQNVRFLPQDASRME